MASLILIAAALIFIAFLIGAYQVIRDLKRKEREQRDHTSQSPFGRKAIPH
jgi:flagellar biosynthesis/type III secretory pathway M-ring protein FliF/YscJ